MYGSNLDQPPAEKKVKNIQLYSPLSRCRTQVYRQLCVLAVLGVLAVLVIL